MKRFLFLFLIFPVFLQSCDFRTREKAIVQKEKEISRKEQQLLLWEQRLTMEEKELEKTKQSLDSTKKQIDSTDVYNPLLVGTWLVKMSCVETTCEGSAIGDTKTEQWEIAYQDKSIVVKAYSGKKLGRIYNGFYRKDGLQLVNGQSGGETLIRAILHLTEDNRMEGSREILQSDCKIVYSLVAERL